MATGSSLYTAASEKTGARKLLQLGANPFSGFG